MANELLNEVLQPRTGRALIVRTGEVLRITDLEGEQVVDVAIFNANNHRDRLSLVLFHHALCDAIQRAPLRAARACAP